MTISNKKYLKAATDAGFYVESSFIGVTKSGGDITIRLRVFADLLAAEAMRWIPVSEGNPEDGKDLFILTKIGVLAPSRKIVFGKFVGGHYLTGFEVVEATHYRYINLPEAV